MAENNVTITWDNTPIEIIDRDSLELNKIDDNGTIGEMIDTINANFQNIAKHGGGPAGKDGTNGINGVDGTSAEYIYALSDVMEPGEQYPLDDLGKEELFTRVHNGEHGMNMHNQSLKTRKMNMYLSDIRLHLELGYMKGLLYYGLTGVRVVQMVMVWNTYS